MRFRTCARASSGPGLVTTRIGSWQLVEVVKTAAARDGSVPSPAAESVFKLQIVDEGVRQAGPGEIGAKTRSHM